MNRRRLALAAAASAVALGCADTTPLAGAPADGLKQPTHVAAVGATTAVAGLQPVLWASATALVTPGPASGPNAIYLAFAINAGPNSLPGALPQPTPAGVGTVYMFHGNTGNAKDPDSMFAKIAGAVIVPNPTTGGGTATLTGTNSEGFPFTIKVVDNNSATKADTLTVDAPGLFKASVTIDTGDIRIVRALPRNQGAVGQAGVVFDKEIGLFIAQADAVKGLIGPQSPLSVFTNEITPPVAQLPAPDAPPGDTTNQAQIFLVRNVPNLVKP